MNNMNNQQQSPFEWMKFIPIQGEKHLGIAVMRYEKRFIFRFKIMPSDHGGYWATTASFKTGTANGKDKYEPSFSLDSDYEKSVLMQFVIENVEREIAQNQQQQSNTSVFSMQQAQPMQSQQQAQQQQYARAYQAPQPTMNFAQNGNAHGNNQFQTQINDDHVPF